MNTFYTQLPALKYIDDNKNKHLHLFGSDKNNKDKIVKQFHCLTYDKIFNITNNKNTNYYEYYDKNENIKLFIDIDYKLTENNKYNNIDILIDETINLINDKLKTNYDIEKQTIIVLNASTEQKLSSHIIYPNVIFKSAIHIKQFLINIDSQLINDGIIDISIYRNGLVFLKTKGECKKTSPSIIK